MASCSSGMIGVLIDPEYIQFLLDPDLEFSCYFVVGNPELAPVEKIGVVRKMLAAHSDVFRAQLMKRRWKSEEPEHINDIFPETFRNLLRFVYGFDTTATMSFDDADDLLYVADRYIMPKLKDKVATRLMCLLDYTNICSLLTNPACARALELQKEMSMIIQHQTDKILEQPQFLSCCPKAFVKILEEEALNVSEMDLWKSALKWAKNRVKSDDPKVLRQQLEKPLKHIRIGALPLAEFWDEVAPADIFTEEEKLAVGLAHATGAKPDSLTAVSDKMEPRIRTVSGRKLDGQWHDYFDNMTTDLGIYFRDGVVQAMTSSFKLHTYNSLVEIVSLVCYVEDRGIYNFTVGVITEEPMVFTRRSLQQESEAPKSPEPIYFRSTHHASGKENLHIRLSTHEREVMLSQHTSYDITISCDRQFTVFKTSGAFENLRHFEWSCSYIPSLEMGRGRAQYGSPVTQIHYRALTPHFKL